MTPDATRPDPPAHRDRSTRLLVAGVFLLVLGCGALLLGAFSAVSVFLVPQASGGPPYGPAQAIPGLALYGGLGAALITLAVGSFRARRWVRPLALITGWTWLVVGALTTVMTAFMVPAVLESLPGEDPAAPRVVFGCVGAFLGLLGIVAPAILLLLFRGRDVAATLEARDPQPRWTDRIPTPLLGLSLWFGVTALGMALSSLYALFPTGGTILTGAPAVLLYLALAALWAYVAVQLARRDRTAWWVGLGTVVASGLWALWVFPRTDFAELMRLMGTPQEPGMPDFTAIYQAPWFGAILAVGFAGLLGYMLFVRRYLR